MTKLKLPVSDRDHIQGSKNAPVLLVEYGDYECPFCGKAYPVVKKIQEDLGNDLGFVFRNFPLTEVHPNSGVAAAAAEASALQNKFWEMHDLLYENQDRLNGNNMFYFAKVLGLNTERFIRDMNSLKVQARLEEDFESGVWSGVNGTPTFFINGYRHNGLYTYDVLLNAIEKELNTKIRTV